MDVDTSWGRKRPAEADEQYLASKRYISEKFFNMRISQPEAPGANGVGPIWAGAKGKATSAGDDFEIEGSSMSDDDLTPLGQHPPAAFHNTNNSTGDAGFMAPNSDGDAASGGGGAGGPPTPHPLFRSASSKVDEKVDDWVRHSRHRMLADASVNSAPDLCRALILYKPVLPSAAAAAAAAGDPGAAEDEGGGEGGGDPTPSPQTGGDGGGETAPSPSAAAAAAAGLGAMSRGGRRINISSINSSSSSSSEQSMGSSTAEAAAGFTGGRGARTERGRMMDGDGQHQHQYRRVAGSLFGRSPPPHPGLCAAQSGGDDAGGGMLMRDDSDVGGAGGRMVSVDEMDMDAGDEGAGAGAGPGAGGEGESSSEASWNRGPPEPPSLTRTGRSRGAPTPDLTPERAAWARAANQRRGHARGKNPDEVGGGQNAAERPALSAQQSWARW